MRRNADGQRCCLNNCSRGIIASSASGLACLLDLPCMRHWEQQQPSRGPAHVLNFSPFLVTPQARRRGPADGRRLSQH